MVTLNASVARQKFFAILRGVTTRNQLYRVVYGSDEAIIMSEDEYESLMETLYLLSSPGFRMAFRRARGEIKHGKTVPWQVALGVSRAKV